MHGSWDMKQIYSKVSPNKLILSLIKFEDISEYRTDICPEQEYLQISGRKLKKGLKVAPHKHTPIERITYITQEAWIVLSGRIRGKFYDLDDSVLCEVEIEKGDVVVLFRGGHSLEVLEKNTIFYEFKTGPYLGVEADKENI